MTSQSPPSEHPLSVSGSITVRSSMDDPAARGKSPSVHMNTELPASKEAADLEAAATTPLVDPNSDKYVTGYKLVLIFIGMLFSAFLVSLDQTILATAIPKIASQFNSLEQVTWIASAYFLTQCSLILTYGKLLSSVTTKWVYLFAVALFEVGSAICGAAPNMNTLIFGRALAGCGAAGIFQLYTILTSLFSLPFGGVTILSILAFIKPEHSSVPPSDFRTTLKRLAGIDWIGSILSIGMVTSILLPLQWGGVTKPWDDKSVIALFCVFGVLLIVFIAWEWYQGDNAVMPLTLWKNRAQIACCIEAFFLMLVLLCCTYYLPLYYQSAKQHSATKSGIDIIAFMNAIIAIQAEYATRPEMVPMSTALVNFTQLFGGVLGIAIAGTIFGNQLSTFIRVDAPSLPPEVVNAVKQSVEVIATLPRDEQGPVIKAYSKALGYVFILGIPSAILASVSGMFVPNYDLKALGVNQGVHAV
ncbi:hypothetical protein FRB99_002145 [Tulasnella sp. 403]|nr:hypothetical protein FRB99_002145 [Tulasnella sp. 403]